MKHPNISKETLVTNLSNSEQLILQTYKLRPLPFQRGYKFIKGKYPILLSAPHSARTIREGDIKLREIYVGSFVQLLSKMCNVYGIYTTNIIIDPNSNNLSCYKRKIKSLIDKNLIKFVLDIHGAVDSYGFDIDIGTYKTKSLLGKKKIVNIFKRSFTSYGFSNISTDFFTSKPNDTITRFSSSNKIPAVQLEIPRQIRNLKKNTYKTIQMFNALHEIIETLKLDFTGGRKPYLST